MIDTEKLCEIVRTIFGPREYRNETSGGADIIQVNDTRIKKFKIPGAIEFAGIFSKNIFPFLFYRF